MAARPGPVPHPPGMTLNAVVTTNSRLRPPVTAAARLPTGFPAYLSEVMKARMRSRVGGACQIDQLLATYRWLELTPLGRQRHVTEFPYHDTYDRQP
jgi:predicted dithiol-disulfide oxidoreductase (DUF899 family)